MQNSDIARLFEELADLLEIQGANPFRMRAYRNAARLMEGLAEPLVELAEQGPAALTGLPGIGKEIAEKIAAIVSTGQLAQLEAARAEVPAGVVQMLRIPGVGPKKTMTLWKELGVTSLDQLKAAVENGDVARLKGFGARSAQTILDGLDQARQAAARVHFAAAKPLVEELVAHLRSLSTVRHVSPAGSYRRCKETVGDLDLLTTAADSAGVMDALAAHPLVDRVLARGETKQRVRLKPLFDGGTQLEMDLRVVPEESCGAAMQYFTGSKEHNIVVRRMAQEHGLKINEYGVYRDGQYVAGRTEEEVYAAIGLPWIAPELREDRGEFERALTGRLPRLIELSDMRGDLHMHTTATDGSASIRDMAEAARARGLEYIAITDHSKRVAMANGLDADRLRQHWREIDKVRAQVTGIEILKGIECDILEDATLDLPDDVLAEADWVIAVLHYGLKQPREQINQRLLNAIRNPHVDVIGHPTGRVIGRRPGADASWPDIFKAAADYGVMLEINAHHSRLDLDDAHAAAARALGIPIVISTDAHSTAGFGEMEFGICQARRAGLEAKDVANTRPLAEFRQLL